MSLNQLIVINYLVLWGAARIRGCVRRWQQPVLRGPEWFFNVQVQPGFYTGPGKKLLNRYRLRMLMPFALEIPIAAAILISGHVQNLVWLILGMSILIHVNHLFSVDLQERQARAFAVAEAEEPVPAMVVSLKKRRLSDYSNRRLDRLFAFASIAGIAWLVRYFVQTPGQHDWRIFLVPLLLLYLEGAILFAKHVILAWRTPVPQGQAEEYVNAREEARKFYFAVCDLNRMPNIAMLVAFPFFLRMSRANMQRFAIAWMAAWLAINAAVLVWGEIRRKRVLAAALRARPMRFPDLLGTAQSPSWPVCYLPSAPMLVLKGVRGYSLNFANHLAQFGAAYLAAGVAIFTIIWRVGY